MVKTIEDMRQKIFDWKNHKINSGFDQLTEIFDSKILHEDVNRANKIEFLIK
jgi:hypothetical protein